jgi:hypothetical protein
MNIAVCTLHVRANPSRSCRPLLRCAMVGLIVHLALAAIAHAEPGQAPDRIFGVLPNVTTVEDPTVVPPITTKATLRMAALSSFDPYVFPFVGALAGVAQVESHDRSWGFGTAGYGRRFAVSMADNSVGSFLTTAITPALFHQDPRYFELREGGVWQRARYAATRTLITRTRAGQRQFNYSDIGGNAAAAIISNAYYPTAARSLSGTATRWATQVMWDSLSNELKEFWPDIRRTLHKP